MNVALAECEKKMQKTISAFEQELASIRAGRANAAVLDKITVDYYGSPTQITQLAEVKVTEARILIITPWDPKTLKEIEKSINMSDLGINPQNDGKMIRLVFPALTEDRRREITKQVSKMGEEAKIALRNIRRDAIDKIKTQKKNGELTEDEQKTEEKSAQELTDKYTKSVDTIVEKKNKELMEI